MKTATVIKETTDYYPLSVLFHNSEMGIEISHTTPEGMVKMWRMEDSETGDLLAAVTLQIRDGVYTLGDLAVKAGHRSEGYGWQMQQTLFAEAARMGLKELWSCAKVPDYYLRFGWQRMDWDTSPKIDINCHTCSRLGTTCHPSVIRKVIEE